ncbi:MAG TPA: Mur ligase family protein [Allosphingosinicella sp.]|jgi:UDP-N-acetylmuramate--alanine ligase|nr:Mur ligase family protein [Allosphingosinicella sp.]
MESGRPYFFCGIGGSGMLPLACIVRARSHEVAGSDRSLDQQRLGAKFEFLQRLGIGLFPQDGSGLTRPEQVLVTSAAIEETVPDVVKAREIGAARVTRPQLLAELFNAAPVGIAVAGTSGKSTTTGMIGWILHAAGRAPTVMNGAVMKNFVSDETPFASALVGGGDAFVSEVDESDGSIALYRPKVAVLNNITLDHKSLDELRGLFRDFALKAETVVLNLDDEETRLLASALPADKVITYSAKDESADYFSLGFDLAAGSTRFSVRDKRSGETRMAYLRMWGAHNGYNGLAAIAAATAAGVSFADAVDALATFEGLRRRFEEVGTSNGILVVDDFAHNPDKIAATLTAAREYLEGRLLVFFQPHGFGPLKAMRRELIESFVANLSGEDLLILSDPVYFGGTVDRSVGSGDITEGVRAAGCNAEHIPERARCGERLAELARPGDRILIMGARDDTLSQFAEEVLGRL